MPEPKRTLGDVVRRVLGKGKKQPAKKPVKKQTREEIVDQGKRKMKRIQERLELEKQFGVTRGGGRR